ncbi:serine O-acetyltransferase [Rhizobium rhododendri]|uniref:Serine acetyltransferase n=1 Tax=Rhizobium rhododendri TaxID=2506430 RepID=A0ABY8IP41_9HYPH|nr:DapH/DapD/GlmU-related protein [Rhizobium rhododendri]WFS25215.1 DapH/DapD/GlmU-related protein [Rhizobium rhododendri]
MQRDINWKQDLDRITGTSKFFREQSLWAIWVYRYGRRNDLRKPGPFRFINNKTYWMMFRLVETVTGVSIPKECVIGAGLRIWHFGGIFIHPNSIIGANCTLRQGVTIGNRTNDGGAPVIGDDVEIGAYAQILGPVKIGSGAKIGAMSVVLTDLPSGCTAVGNPARIIE